MDEIESDFYSRQLVLADIGLFGQQMLNNAKVLVVGAGGLGSPVLQYLAGAGVGTIGIVDGDNVSISNLHRQMIYSVEDVGKSKALCAAKRIIDSNPFISVKAYEEHLSSKNAAFFFSQYDIIVDCTDNYSARYLINDACVLYNRPWVSASIYKFEGQLSVFNHNDGPTYRCLFPETPHGDSIANCSEAGVIGVLPGILGTLQANEVIKLILGKGELLSGMVLKYHSQRNSFTLFELKRSENFRKVTEFIEIDKVPSCGLAMIESLNPESLEQCINDERWLLIDVREVHELPRMSAENLVEIPLQDLEKEAVHLPEDKSLLVFCASGVRSTAAVKLITKINPQMNVFNLTGGLSSYTINLWNQLQQPQ